MKDIHCIVSDLDGTLLSPDHSLPERVKSAITGYVSKGGLFTVATGRPYLTAKAIIDQIGIEIPVILCNGAVLAKGHEILERCCLPAARVADMLIDAYKQGIQVLLFRDHTIEVFEKNEDILAFEHKENVTCTVIEDDSISWLSGDLEKVILLGDVEKIFDIGEKWAEALAASITMFQSEPNFVEIVAADVSKGSALSRLANILGIREENMLAIGNQMNDLPMLQAAGVGVAVANSTEELKKAADYVTTASYGDGVIEALEQYVYRRKKEWQYVD